MSDIETKIPKPPKGITICMQVVMCIMPIAQLAIGAAYNHDCPKQPYIPIYLIVVGVTCLLMNLLSFLPQKIPTMVLMGLISLFGTCWFIAGNVWIYSAYEPNYNQTTATIDDPYCNKTLYLFAFWTTTLYYILAGFSILSLCCTACLACCAS